MTAPYLVDSNFFIQAHRLYYPFDVVPGFWLKVRELAERGIIISIDKVRDEIYGKDALTDWCKNNLPDDFFKDTSVIIEDYIEVSRWVNSKSHYNEQALNEFLDADEADAWLVSYAKANNNRIVTHETSEPARKNKVKIPDACSPFNIDCVTTIGMFREIGESF